MSSFTLFLDRDGVINTEIPNDYVKAWDQFFFEHNVFEALLILKEKFNRIIVVTNQRGVGAGLMTQEALDVIHNKMIAEFKLRDIIIDKIYAATDEDRSSSKRKPSPYLGLCAQEDFPEIDFHNSLMVGNSPSDMDFGKALKARTLFVDDKRKFTDVSQIKNADFEADSLFEFAIKVQNRTIEIF
ncbi:MAG: HAD-IIIA family hydrolase [Bacteroidetes bacterium]|nr:HAD-IIIA family hydrolase [Bacteroidota bacterium]